MTNYLTPVLWFSNERLNFALPDLNLTKNRKTTNNSATMDIPSESNKQHLDKVLTFIGLIGAGYLTCSMTVQKVQIQTCQIWRKIENCQTCWKASILLPKVVTWWSTGYDIGSVDLKRSCSRSPVPWFSKRGKILHVWTCQIWHKIKNCQTCWKPSILLPEVVTWWSTGYDVRRVDLKRSWLVDLQFLHFPKSEKFCMSGSKNDKQFSNYWYPIWE